MFDVAVWGTVSDVVSSIATVVGVGFGMFAYWNWKSTVINEREFELLNELLGKLSLLHRHSEDIREDGVVKALELHAEIVELVESKRHLLNYATLCELTPALRHIESSLTRKKAGVEEPSNTVLLCDIRELVIERIRPTPLRTRIWRRIKPRRYRFPRLSVKD